MSENASRPIDNANAWFYRSTDLPALLQDVAPISSIEDLALDDLDADAAAVFLQAIAE
jgi:hypothetical protein